MQQTFDEYLLKLLDEPVRLKDGSIAKDADGNILTREQAIATNLINKAMQGDYKAIQYINNVKITQRNNGAMEQVNINQFHQDLHNFNKGTETRRRSRGGTGG
jgi:hypothetical protein